MQLDAGKTGHLELFRIDPDQILLPARNGRAAEHSDEDILARMESIREVGQLAPVICRRLPNKKVELVAGFLRLAAIKRLNAEGAEPPIQVHVRVVDGINEESSFIRNLRENMDRVDLTAVDHSHNQAVLRNEYGWDDAKIAGFYNKSPSWVRLHAKVGFLAAPIQQEIRNGNLPLTTAAQVADLPEKKQRAVLDAARDTSGRVNGSKVKQQVRAEKQATGDKTPARTLADVRAFFGGLLKPKDSAGMRSLVEVMDKYISGSITDQQAEKELRENI